MLSRFEKFICDINEIDLHWHRIASAGMRMYGLKGATSIYLIRLHGVPEGMTASELGTACARDKADVSRNLRLLEGAGLVKREKGYRAKVTLTEQGTALASELIRKAEFAVEFVGGELTDNERDIFYDVLGRIIENMKTLSVIGLDEEN